MVKLERDFFLEDSATVAKKLLGKIFVKLTPEGILSGRIVETEAYSQDEPACHACRGMTKRNASLFGEAGHAYVYFTYGMHHCLNFVTQPEGRAEGVLIRALQPLEGIDIMKHHRKTPRIHNLCSGPGKLTKAFAIGLETNGVDLMGDQLYVMDDNINIGEIISTPRIGISEALDLLWRFYPLKYKEWISR